LLNNEFGLLLNMKRERLAYHEMMAILGVGDLHPGGSRSTELLLSELDRVQPGRVLEIGAGGGWTTARMIRRGWWVTPIEPSAVLCDCLRGRSGVQVQPTSFESFDSHGVVFDAAIGEGVFYRLEPQRTVSKIRGLLRPGGLLAFVDMLWTRAAKADVAAFVHDRTIEMFGIPAVPREVVTDSDWSAALSRGGFSEVVTKPIEPQARHPGQNLRRARLALGLLAHPKVVPLFLRYHMYRQITLVPPDWLNAWMSVWRRD
jgi:SAM-dependent methyltransferase